VCSRIVALDVLDVDVLAADALADALAADALGDALADALAVGEAVDWERLLCDTVVLCAVVVACGDVVSPVVVVVPACCAPVAPVVAVVVPVIVPVVPVVPVVAVIVPVVGVVVPVEVVVVGVVDSGREVAARSSRFATVGPFSPLIPRLMVAFEELSIAPVSTLAHSCSLNTLTTARPRPSGRPLPALPPPAHHQDEPPGWCVGDPSPPSRGQTRWPLLSLNHR
jgi:hypothetical protein